jgi:hypothetical protein
LRILAVTKPVSLIYCEPSQQTRFFNIREHTPTTYLEASAPGKARKSAAYEWTFPD